MSHNYSRLKREFGVIGATVMGLGAILGTGVFVSLGLAAGITGPAVILAVMLATGRRGDLPRILARLNEDEPPLLGA